MKRKLVIRDYDWLGPFDKNDTQSDWGEIEPDEETSMDVTPEEMDRIIRLIDDTRLYKIRGRER